jgi:hypothetical protein
MKSLIPRFQVLSDGPVSERAGRYGRSILTIGKVALDACRRAGVWVAVGIT